MSKYGMTKVLSHGESGVAISRLTPIEGSLRLWTIRYQENGFSRCFNPKIIAVTWFFEPAEKLKPWSVVMHIFQWEVIGKRSVSWFQKFLQAYGTDLSVSPFSPPQTGLSLFIFQAFLQIPYLALNFSFHFPWEVMRHETLKLTPFTAFAIKAWNVNIDRPVWSGKRGETEKSTP